MDKKLLTTLTLSFLTVMALHYFLPGGKQVPQQGAVPVLEAIVPGQAYQVPTVQDLAQPLKREIDFVDTRRTQKEEIIPVETEKISARFSTYGGVLSQLDFKEHEGENNRPLRTVHYKTFSEQEQGCFLLAFDEKTPYFYKLIDTTNTDDGIETTFEASVDQWVVRKTYRMKNNSYLIDLVLSFRPKTKDPMPIRPRLFFSGPFMPEALVSAGAAGSFTRGSGMTSLYMYPLEGGGMQGVVTGIDGIVQTISQGNELDKAWVMPEMFGTQSKYFAHLLTNDPTHFIQRAFYKVVGGNTLYSVLEGPSVVDKQEFSLSFYFGPKTTSALRAVDDRLTNLFSFGWLHWVCMLLLQFLQLLYGFVGNYGVAIVIMAILLEIPFIPLTLRAKKTMEEHARYQPAITHIRKKYKGDTQAMQVELMRFYKEHNLSPAGQMLGCLPLLLQMPIIFSLYRVLGNSLGLYQAPFIWWITDLSSKDPYYVLPVIMGASMMAQQYFNPTGDERSRVIMMFTSVLMIALFIGFPAGVVLYWATRNLITLGVECSRKLFV